MSDFLAFARETVICLFVTGCGVPVSETVAGPAAGRDWVLESLADAPARAAFTIGFSDSGALNGAGPCNRFTARQTAPLPWFAMEELSMTGRACPEQAEETRYIEALQRMALAEVAGTTLILSNDDGETMVFRAR